MQVFARVYSTFPSLLYVETPALPRFASRSVTMRGGLDRVSQNRPRPPQNSPQDVQASRRGAPEAA